MTQLPHVHLCIVQPSGYVHSLGFLDQARYFRHQFRRMGAQVSLAKNRLRHDAVNFVFGAHLGFDAALRQRYSCVFVNLEQLGQGGAAVSRDYLQLLATSAVVDYDADNVAAYAAVPAEVPIVPFLYAPYLSQLEFLPLEDRPIDLLFIGSMNDRRRAMINRIEAQGVKVSLFDSPLYGPERDQMIVQSKAVFNAHFYPTSRFEQARVSHCLSVGTPVISERAPQSMPHAAFENSVIWVDESNLDTYFAEQFGSPYFYEMAIQSLVNFQDADPIEAYADLMAFAVGFGRAHQLARPSDDWRPARINLGSGKDYKPGWLNIDVLDRAQPDLVLDLGRPVSWPVKVKTPYGGHVCLEEGGAELIYANNVLEHVPDLPELMGNCLKLLKTGGKFLLEVPYEHAATAWQDPTHLRALNEKSWLYYTDWFWYLGWFEHRFTVEQFGYLDDKLKECAKDKAAFMRVVLTKVVTTMKERTTARVMRADFALPDDLPAADVGADEVRPGMVLHKPGKKHVVNKSGVRDKVGRSDVTIGRFTYGMEHLSVREWGEGATLNIGSFCSIASSVTIFLGGNHRVDWVSTYPFGHLYADELGGQGIKGHPATNGDVVIGHDVWIGHGATIMSGVTIGDGAVIAANAQVVKDVAPYEIVGGNPAKHLKFRFDEDVRGALSRLQWWALPEEDILQIAEILSAQPTLAAIEALVQRFRIVAPVLEATHA
ncbi:methyltransferase domain-containing protein [Aquabacterium sp.]|uniref:methyltransferase domain-containing protein n=1 Tax=Aquabacterium sp. TaxID=1872578 RepID=UPI00248748A3|nr:methyltransferase domain-containing protein [Aquabacterium sp.]MDI1258556.1 methyltransferase domain-containing protein [Aquabacterium sp.]